MATAPRDYAIQRINEIFTSKIAELNEQRPKERYMTDEEIYEALKKGTATLKPINDSEVRGRSISSNWFKFPLKEKYKEEYKKASLEIDQKRDKLKAERTRICDIIKLSSLGKDYLKLINDFEKFKL